MSNFYVHEKAFCESTSIGENTRIWAFSHIMKDVIIGVDCNFGDHSFVESGVIIGNRVTVKNGVSIWNGVEIEDDVFLGPNCVFTNDLFPRSKMYHSENVRTYLKIGSSIGANATIICGVIIGEYSLVGAGSVVTKDVPSYSIVVGVPGKVRGFVSMDGERLLFDSKDIAIDIKNNIYKKLDSQTVILLEKNI
jgi:acetyltransferase-like isoleucine patch superfamily enzyme